MVRPSVCLITHPPKLLESYYYNYLYNNENNYDNNQNYNYYNNYFFVIFFSEWQIRLVLFLYMGLLTN